MSKVASVLVAGSLMAASGAALAAPNDTVITGAGAVITTEPAEIYADVSFGKLTKPIGHTVANQPLCAGLVAPGNFVGMQQADGSWIYFSNAPGKLKPGPAVGNCKEPAKAGPMPIADVASAAIAASIAPQSPGRLWVIVTVIVLCSAFVFLVNIAWHARGAVSRALARSTNPHLKGLRNVGLSMSLLVGIPIGLACILLVTLAFYATLFEMGTPLHVDFVHRWGAAIAALSAIGFFAYWTGSRSRTAIVLSIVSMLLFVALGNLFFMMGPPAGSACDRPWIHDPGC